MNKEITDKLIEYIDSTKDWVLETAPEIFQQIVTYGFWKSLILSALFFSIGLACVFLIRFCYKAPKDQWNMMQDRYVALSLISGVIALIFFVGFLCNIETFIKATVAPKLYIIDYLRGK